MPKPKKKTAQSQMKADIIHFLERYKIENRISDTELTKRCKCKSKGTISRMFKNNGEGMTLDLLVTFLQALNYKAGVQIEPIV